MYFQRHEATTHLKHQNFLYDLAVLMQHNIQIQPFNLRHLKKIPYHFMAYPRPIIYCNSNYPYCFDPEKVPRLVANFIFNSKYNAVACPKKPGWGGGVGWWVGGHKVISQHVISKTYLI